MDLNTNPFVGPIGQALIIEEFPHIVDQGGARWFVSRVNMRSYDPRYPVLDEVPDFAELEDAEQWLRDRDVKFQVRPLERK